MSSPRILAATGLAPAIWGTTYLTTTQLLPAGRPLLAAVLRALPAGLVLIAISPASAGRHLVVARARARSTEHRCVLRPLVRRRLPASRRRCRDDHRRAAVAGHRAFRVAPFRARLGTTRARRSRRRHGSRPARPSRRHDAGCRRRRGGRGCSGRLRHGHRVEQAVALPAPLLATTGWQLAAGGLLAAAFRAGSRGVSGER